MEVFNLNKSPLNIQKCLLPDCVFLKRNFGKYCIISQNDRKSIVKIALNEVKNVEGLFLDDSVSVISTLERGKNTRRFNNLTFEDFEILDKPRIARVVRITVVFADFLDLRTHKSYLNDFVRDILKLYVFCKNSIISLGCLGVNQSFGISCIFVENVNDSARIFGVDSSTEIIVGECISQVKFDQLQVKEKTNRVGGCQKAYNILLETLEFAKCFKNIKFINKLLLIGPPGCGKTTLVKNVTSDTKTILLEIQPSQIDILSPVEMENKLKNLFEEAKVYAKEKQVCVILVEDIDLMCGRTILAKRFIAELISHLEDIDDIAGVVVVATTNSPDEVEMQLRRPKRLEDELEIMIPSAEERVEIFEKIFSHFELELNKEVFGVLTKWTPGFVGADLNLLVVETLVALKKKGLTPPVDQQQLKKCFKLALTKVIPSALRGTVGLCTANTTSFSQIGGLEEIKKTLDLLVKRQLENPGMFKKFGIPLTKGILLFGPPGCAKTTLVKALAQECHATFLATSAADLYSPFVGDAEKKIVQLFTQARIGSPSILFIDEIDAVVGSKSGDRERGVQERILSTLLIEMDGVGLKVNTQRENSLNILTCEKETKKETNSGVIVIGATNRPQLLDDALKRPGRFDRLLYVPPPNASERLKILKKLTEKMSLDDSVDLEVLSQLTEFYSGADLKNLCQETGLHALKSSSMRAQSVNHSHFKHVIDECKPSLSEKVVDFYENFQKYNI